MSTFGLDDSRQALAALIKKAHDDWVDQTLNDDNPHTPLLEDFVADAVLAWQAQHGRLCGGGVGVVPERRRVRTTRVCRHAGSRSRGDGAWRLHRWVSRCG